MFGFLEVQGGGRTLGPRDFGSVKAKQVLEILLTARGRPVSKDRLADLLWGDRLPRDHTATLESYVSVLRGRLEPRGPARQSAVVTESGAYSLDMAKVNVDLDDFDRLVAEAQGESPLAALARYRQAAALVRGGVLDDEPYAEWGQALRDYYRRQVCETLVTAARLALVLGDPADAVDLAELAISTDSLAEEAYQVAMVAFYRRGRQVDAVRTFHRCRQALATQLEVQPMAETARLCAAVLAHNDDVLLPPRRLRTSGRPMLGRDHQLAQLEGHVRAAAEGRFALVLVKGDAGIGKSRLLDELQGRLEDGIEVVRWRCLELDAQLPFLAITGALGHLDDGPMANDVPRRLVERSALTPVDTLGLLDQLVAQAVRRAPFVLLIDRLDLADSASISALGYLQRRLADTAVTVIATSRSAAAGRPPLSQLEWSARVGLDRLTEDDLAHLQLPGLHGRTGGHPMLVTGCLDSGGHHSDLAPIHVRDWVLDWCRDASGAELHTLTAAAGLAQPFDPELLASVLNADPVATAGELCQLCQHGLLVEDGTGFAFRDPPVRQILWENTSTTYRRTIAKRISQAEELQHAKGRGSRTTGLVPARRDQPDGELLVETAC
jgi:DNA-binding SARP family transcriptional activator